MNHTEIRAALSLAAVYVLRMLGLFMVMPVLAVLATDYPDFTPLLLGLAIGGYGLTQAVLQIPMGMLSDKLGRKPVIIAGLIFFALGSWLAAIADNMVMLVLGRMLQGAGAIAGAVMALAGDVSRESQRSKVMAVIGVAIGFSFYLALLLGPVLANGYGLQGIFLVTAVLAVLCIPLVWWVVPDARNYAPSGDTLPTLSDVKKLFFNPALARLNVSVMVLHLLITLLFMQLPILLSKQGLGLEQHWSVYLPVLIASVVAMAGLMAVARKRGQNKVMLISIGLLIAAFSGFAVSGEHFWWLILCIWVFFTGFNFLEANLPALVSSIAPAGKKGSAMGIYASLQFFGAFAGGAISGLLTEYFMPQLIFVVAAGLCVVWLLLMRTMDSAERLKRYTLPVNLSAQSADQLGANLAQLSGVRDITLIPEQNIVYLKVDDAFNLREAKQLASFE